MRTHLLALVAGAVISGSVSAQGLRIRDATVSEAGTSGTNVIVFRVDVARDTLAPGGQVSVQYQGASGTATVVATQCAPGVDVVLQPSTLTIPANQTVGQIVATLCDDALDEADSETFTVNLLNPLGANIQGGQATGTVLDDDPTPSLSVANVAAAEGNVGEQRNLTFTINLSAASGRTVSVNWAVTNGSGNFPAASGGAACGGNTDYVTRNGNETFPLGTTSRQVAITLCGDALPEQDERLTLTLSAPTNATLANATAAGTISNDDPFPRVAISAPAAAVTEGTGGTTQASFTLTIDRAPQAPAQVTVALDPVGNQTVLNPTCADPRTDVAAPATTIVTWAVGDQSPKQVTVTICGDNRDDADIDRLRATIGGFVGVEAAGATTADLSIADDDAPPSIFLRDATVAEPATAGTSTYVSVRVELSAPSNRNIVVVLVTREITPTLPLESATVATMGSNCRTAGVDFAREFGPVTLAAGEVAKDFGPIQICHDGRAEGAVVASNPSHPVNRNAWANMEQFEVFLSTVASAENGVTVGDGVARVVITDR